VIISYDTMTRCSNQLANANFRIVIVVSVAAEFFVCHAQHMLESDTFLLCRLFNCGFLSVCLLTRVLEVVPAGHRDL